MTSASGGDEAIARHREIIDLIYYHEKSVDDCALILGIPAATVKTRMFLRPQEVGGAGPAGGALATAPDLGRGEEALAETRQGLRAIQCKHAGVA